MRLSEHLIINLTRNFWKNTLLFLLLTLLSLGALITLITRDAVDNSITGLRRSMPAVVTAVFDESRFDEVNEFIENNPNERLPFFNFLTPTQMEQIANLDYVKFYDYMIDDRIFKQWDFAEVAFSTPLGENELNLFNLIGTSNPNVTFIQNGMLELVEGRTFLQSEMSNDRLIAPILMSIELAELNNLQIGDSFIVERSLFFPPDEIDTSLTIEELYDKYALQNVIYVSYEFEIVGLFTIEKEDDISNLDILNRQQLLNTLITPNWRTFDMHERGQLAWIEFTYLFEDLYRARGLFIMGHQMATQTIHRNEPFFVLYDILDYEAFEESASVYLPDFWHFQNFFSAFESVYLRISPLRNFMNIGLILVIVASVFIISLVLILILRERKKEVAVYLALGQKKKKIAIALLTEIFIIATFSFIISLGVSSFVGPRISHNLVANELLNDDRDMQNFIPSERNLLRERGFGREISPEELMENFDSSISFNTAILFLTGGFAILTISIAAPLVMIFEEKTKDLLSS